MQDMQLLWKKYEQIIQEEVNVKELKLLPPTVLGKKIIKPLGKALSPKYGKETAQIIELGKQGSLRELTDGQIAIVSPDKERILAPDEYEIAFEGDLSDDMALEGNIVVKLDLTLTDELKREGIARELSRFFNQLRKDADCQVDERVKLHIHTASDSLKQILNEHQVFLMEEWLISGRELVSQPAGTELVTDEGSLYTQLIRHAG